MVQFDIQFERKRKHVDSAVECYMASFGVSEEEAYKELQHQVEEAWLDLNEEMLRPTTVFMRLLTPITNMCKALYDIYKIGEDALNMPITIIKFKHFLFIQLSKIYTIN